MSKAGRLSSTLITTFGLGHMRPASGTWGSLPPFLWAAGMVLLAWLTPMDAIAWWLHHLGLSAMVLVFSWAVIVGADRAEAVYGHDPSEIVADETAGQALTLSLMPIGFIAGGIWTAALGLGAAFILFRALDILKPFPCGRLQRVPGAWGVLLDDLVAAIYAGAGLWVLWLLLGSRLITTPG